MSQRPDREPAIGRDLADALELLALRRMPTAPFAVLMSLGPAIATLAGWLVLRQALTVLECAAVVLVIAASMGAVLLAAGAAGDPKLTEAAWRAAGARDAAPRRG
mgnify:CR=1 FL=1